jgi:peptidyl-prolyl cis-trans isomerase D
VKRTAAPDATGPLSNPKFLDALFGDDAVKNKRNTEAIEVGPSQMVSGRVVKYEAARQLPLADVKARVRDQLIATQSAALARKAGTDRLAVLRATPGTALSGPTKTVSRAQPQDLSRDLLEAVLKAPAASLPAVVGVDLGSEGYAVAKILKIGGRDPAVADASLAQAQYAQSWADAEAQAYYAALRQRFNVQISAPAPPAGEAPAGVSR